MKNHFANYNQSLALKELGFDEPCFAGYRDSAWIGTDGPNSRYFHAQLFSNHQFDNDQKEYCSAPLKSQVFEWFREKHKIEATVACYYNNKLDISYEEREYHCYIVRDGITTKGPKFKTYEEAESACIDKLIEIVKNK